MICVGNTTRSGGFGGGAGVGAQAASVKAHAPAAIVTLEIRIARFTDPV
jgi:hypothetical protein